MNDNTIKALGSMVCITFLMSLAMLKGLNGIGLAAAIGGLAGLGGFAVGKLTGKKG